VDREQSFLQWLARKSIILIMAPIYFPAAVNMEVGLCHPPVGLNLYVASGIAQNRPCPGC